VAQKPKGPQFETFTFVPAVTKPWKWGGMRREGARHEIPDNQFYLLQNVRFIGGEWRSRGGQTKANAAAASGTAITGIFDGGGVIETPAAPRIYYMREPT
jgi:hypothetical protein